MRLEVPSPHRGEGQGEGLDIRPLAQNVRTVRLVRAVGLTCWLFLTAAACGSGTASVESSPAANSSPAAPTRCTATDGLPDPICTPGAANSADVTQATLKTTICQPGYTSHGIRSDGLAVRPPAAFTDDLKRQGIIAYGYADTNPADYEEDHLIALELGGDGYSTKNLWPQPRYGLHPSAAKGPIENRLHDLVCSGAVTLAAAQTAIASNWETALAVVAPRPTPKPTPASPASSKLFIRITSSSYGSLEAITLAGATCTAKARLPSGNYSKAQGLQGSSTADETGDVSWSYNTSTSTHKGTGTHFVTCRLEGQTASASAPFTV